MTVNGFDAPSVVQEQCTSAPRCPLSLKPPSSSNNGKTEIKGHNNTG